MKSAKLLLPLSLLMSVLLGGLLIAGCGGDNPAGGSPGAGGTSATGNAGTTGAGGNTTGTGGTSTTGAGGNTTGTGGRSTGTGGTSATGAAGSTGTDGGYDGPSLGVDGGGKLPVGSTQCSDGRDNDGDGRIDYNDPECVGPLDNDESSFATGIPGDNSDACKQDCFFDGNSGMGDDHCLWQLKCDPRSTSSSCPYDQQYAQSHANECSVGASQSQACIDHCRRLVPNGCDCFGCCAVPGVATPIRLAPTCTAASFGDPTKCPPCTQVTQCGNPCDRCELCIGKTTVPEDCGRTDGGTPPPDGGGGYDGGGRPNCSDWLACGSATDPTYCAAGFGCVTGCCLPLE
jgi:hypothetical protein